MDQAYNDGAIVPAMRRYRPQRMRRSLVLTAKKPAYGCGGVRPCRHRRFAGPNLAIRKFFVV
jgi:hypothetical protein